MLPRSLLSEPPTQTGYWCLASTRCGNNTANGTPAAITGTGGAVSLTCETYHLLTCGTNVLQFAVPGWTYGAGNTEIPLPNNYICKISVITPDVQLFSVTWNGATSRTVVAGEYVAQSDPLIITAVNRSTVIKVRHTVIVTDAAHVVPYGLRLLGGTINEAQNIGDGLIAGDYCFDLNTQIPTSTAASGMAPMCIFALSSTRVKTGINIGDSIDAETQDRGNGEGTGGPGWRAFANQRALKWNSTEPGFMGVLQVAKGGAELADLVTPSESSGRWAMVDLVCTKCSDVYVSTGIGTNDATSASYATMTANRTTVTNRFLAYGSVRKVIWGTMFPKTNSTDGWRTTVNQTPFTNSSGQSGVNVTNWLLAQNAEILSTWAAGCSDPARCQPWDRAAPLRCTSLGVQSATGTYWLPYTTDSLTVTVTSSTQATTSTLRDSGTTGLALNQYRGYTLWGATGANANGVAVVRYNNPTPNGKWGFSTFANSATLGDTYTVNDGNNVDTTHPTSWGDYRSVATFNNAWIDEA